MRKPKLITVSRSLLFIAGILFATYAYNSFTVHTMAPIILLHAKIAGCMEAFVSFSLLLAAVMPSKQLKELDKLCECSK